MRIHTQMQPCVIKAIAQLRFRKQCVKRWSHSQDVGKKGGLSLRGVSLHDGFGSLMAWRFWRAPYPSFCLSYKMQYQEAMTVLTVLVVSAVVEVFGRDGYTP